MKKTFRYSLIVAATSLAMTFSALRVTPTGAALEDDFVITVKTDNPGTSSSTQFTIPTTGSGYNYNVDCNNDGTNEASAQTGNYTCNYAAVGNLHRAYQGQQRRRDGLPQDLLQQYRG